MRIERLSQDHEWGSRVTVSGYNELLRHGPLLLQRMYSSQGKLLVIKGLGDLTLQQLWEVNRLFGIPWSSEDYVTTTERVKYVGEDRVRCLTEYGNIVTAKSIGNRRMPWHRDIPWHREKRYPFRSLYPVKMTLGAGKTGTKFSDCDILFKRLNYADVEELVNTEVRIQSWYQYQYGVPDPQTRWIPLVEEHEATRQLSVLLNSFGPETEGLEYSTPLSGTWILEARNSRDKTPIPLSTVNRWHSLVDTPENVYEHKWELGDFLIFDNSSGVFHARDAVVAEVGAERLFYRANVRHYWQ